MWKARCARGDGLRDELADAPEVAEIVQRVGEKNAEKLNNAGKEKIGFGGNGAKGTLGIQDEGILHQVEGALNDHPIAVEIVPVLGAPLNARTNPEIPVRIGINALSVGGIGAGMLADTEPSGPPANGFGANPLEPQGAAFPAGTAEEDERGTVRRTDWGTGGVKRHIRGFGISGIEWDAGAAEMKLLPEHGIGVIGVKSAVADEGFIGKGRMGGEKIGKNGLQRGRIADFLVALGTFRLGKVQFGMLLPEIPVTEGDVSGNAQPVGENAGLGGIAEMAVDILLTGVGVGFGAIGEKGVNAPVGVESRVGFGNGFCLFELGIEEFGVVLGDLKFDAGGVVDEIIGLFGVYFPADRLGDLHQPLKQFGEEIAVVFPEPGKLGGVRHLGEAAEIPKFGAALQNRDQQDVRRDPQQGFQNQGADKALQVIDVAPL